MEFHRDDTGSVDHIVIKSIKKEMGPGGAAGSPLFNIRWEEARIVRGRNLVWRELNKDISCPRLGLHESEN